VANAPGGGDPEQAAAAATTTVDLRRCVADGYDRYGVWGTPRVEFGAVEAADLCLLQLAPVGSGRGLGEPCTCAHTA
jgi:hypothetical protein